MEREEGRGWERDIGGLKVCRGFIDNDRLKSRRRGLLLVVISLMAIGFPRDCICLLVASSRGIAAVRIIKRLEMNRALKETRRENIFLS